MMIKRCFAYLGLSMALMLGSFSAHAVERVTYLAALTFGVGGSYGEQAVRHKLILDQWQAEAQTGDESVASNLIALSNHFGLAGAAPFDVPDWELSASA